MCFSIVEVVKSRKRGEEEVRKGEGRKDDREEDERR